MTTASVRNEQVRTLYGQSLPVLFANVANSVIVSAALWTTAPRALLVGWTGLMTLMTIVRVELRRRYWRARPGPEEARRWGARFVMGSATAGLLWGGAAVLLYDADGTFSSVLITFAIGGMGAGAAGTLSCYPPAFWGYLVPALCPLIIRTLSFGGTLHLAMAVMLMVYAVALAIVARTTNRSITEAFRLRFENEGLLAELTAAQRQLEETNRGLEQRVVERTAELERQGQALRNAQRMESVGRLAGGIAHDFNNLLTVVHANADLMARQQDLDAPTRIAVTDVLSAATRGADLVRQLLAFSRRQRLSPRVLDLNRLVMDAERLLTRLIGETIEMKVTVAPTRALIRADPSHIEQVIINLVTNARDAMPRGGALTITTSLVEADGAATSAAGSYVVLSVGDTGVGMDPETQRRAFDPFFTTKGVGEGSGLGLATVYGIVEQSGGRISVDSKPGEGSRFDIYLPRATESDLAATDDEIAAVPGESTVGATILIAEDEPEVRSVIGRMLRLAGFDVLLAADGKEAQARARAYQGPIDLLVTDVVMAPVGGLELARELCAERPRLRVLFVTGYTFEHDLPPADPARGIDHLHKPLTFEKLIKKVALLLAGPGHGTGARAALGSGRHRSERG